MSRNYCGDYGCKNCKWFYCYRSYNYYEPDEYECKINDEHFKKVNKEISYNDEELEKIFDRVYGDGEEWNRSEEQICPYYVEYIEKENF